MTEDERSEIVSDIKALLKKKPIDIDFDAKKYSNKVKANSEYKIGTHIGFKFECANWEVLKGDLMANKEFNLDSTSTISGWFMQLATHGTGFRQIGRARSFHIEIDQRDCDIHVDTHGIVAARGMYYFGGMIGHLNWDLIPSYFPSLRLGKTAFLGAYTGYTLKLAEESWLDGLTAQGPTMSKVKRAIGDLIPRAEIGVQLYIGEATGLRATVSGLGDEAKFWGSFETRLGGSAALRVSVAPKEAYFTLEGTWP